MTGGPPLRAAAGQTRLVALLLFGALAAYEAVAYLRFEGPLFVDFFGLWSWGRFVAVEGTAGLYDPAVMHRFQQALDPLYAESYYPFLYPPIILLLLAPLARLDYEAARLLWTAATLAAFLLALPQRQRLLGLVAPATVWCLVGGQNGLLTAALMIGGARLVPARPMLGGALLGLLAYKPHLALLIPVALVASGSARRWRAVAACGAAATAAAMASAVAFGPAVWMDWLRAQGASWTTIEAYVGDRAGYGPTVTAGLSHLGIGGGADAVDRGHQFLVAGIAAEADADGGTRLGIAEPERAQQLCAAQPGAARGAFAAA